MLLFFACIYRDRPLISHGQNLIVIMLFDVKHEKIMCFAEKHSFFAIKGLSLFLLVRETDMTVAERSCMGTVKNFEIRGADKQGRKN